MSSSKNIQDIQSIEFGILSSDDIKTMSVCKVDNTSKMENGKPVHGSVYDPRMGCIVDQNVVCPTCEKKKECWGHFGHIELEEPVMNPIFIKYIILFLKCICKHCHRVMYNKDDNRTINSTGRGAEKRFLHILNYFGKSDICPFCKHPQPNVIKRKEDICFEYSTRGNHNKMVTIANVYDVKKIFDDVTNEDMELMGIDANKMHPKNFILTNFPVIPPCSRPYRIANGDIGDDDLTYQLIEIVKINNKIRDEKLKKLNQDKTYSDQKYQKFVQGLAFRINTMYDNSSTKAKHPTDNRAIKGLKERIHKKEGRMRFNIMGKRVNYSARTVIGAEPTIPTGHLGIPYHVAETHSIPENVNENNIEYLEKLLDEGKINYVTTKKLIRNESGDHELKELTIRPHFGGQETKCTILKKGDIVVHNQENNIQLRCTESGEIIIPPNAKVTFVENKSPKLYKGDIVIRDNEQIDAKYCVKKDFKLKIGDVVGRQLHNGDWVLFNRQPTLHKGSMLAMQVILMPGSTFRFNLAGTGTFNADFDGDEMNLHTPQSYESIAELRTIASMRENIISMQDGRPIINIVQDSLLGAYLMTKTPQKMTRGKFFNISYKGKNADGTPLWNSDRVRHIENVMKSCGKKLDIYTTHNLFSLILPKDFNYSYKNNLSEEFPEVKIVKGVLLEGVLNKDILGGSHISILKFMCKEYGNEITSTFIDNVQFLTNEWLIENSFSIGLEDCMISSDNSIMEIKNNLVQCYMEAQQIEKHTKNPGIREIRITASLSQAKDIGLRISKNAMKKDNNFLCTVHSGAKGGMFNIAQLTGLLGQQNLNGQRVTKNMNHGKRTLPHYPFEITDKKREYESRGFIRHSFIHGLTPEEFFFHAMSGREGICDTATGTADSGYIQRRIVKICEDIQVRYDNTVRCSSNKVYQFMFGHDGLNPMETVKVNGIPQFCDAQRIASQLNSQFENKEDESDEDETDSDIDDEDLDIEDLKIDDVNFDELINGDSESHSNVESENLSDLLSDMEDIDENEENEENEEDTHEDYDSDDFSDDMDAYM